MTANTPTTTARKSASNAKTTKSGRILKLLQRPKGATIAELTHATGWQQHSIRGFLSGTVRKRLGLNVMSEKTDKGTRRYRVTQAQEA